MFLRVAVLVCLKVLIPKDIFFFFSVFFSRASVGYKSRIKMLAGLLPFEGSQEEAVRVSLLAPGGSRQSLAFLGL